MDPHTPQICRFLDWDTQFFGFRIAQITIPVLTIDTTQAVLEWCRKEKISCLYYLAPCGDDQSIHLAEKFSFHLVDVRLAFEIELNQQPKKVASPHIRPARENDLPTLREIARSAFRNTRFFNDGNFSTQVCENLYMTWIEKSCKGYADAVWVVSPGNKPGGFITCHLKNGTGQIGLLGIDPSHHHQGWGHEMVKSALAWFADHNCTSVTVVTQGNNHAAQKLYERCGFSLASIDLWYHRWFNPTPEES